MHQAMSSENQATQKLWCESSSVAIRDGATKTVRETVATLKANKIDVGPVIEIGPQRGYGLQEMKIHADSVMGIEIVPEFHEACEKLGLTCILGAAEDIGDMELPGKHNYYIRETAEHFLDRDKAFKGIMENLLSWVFITVPIEPWEPRDKAHFSKFSSIDEARGLFEGMTKVHEVTREPAGDMVGRYLGLWVK
jgi:hypothetical protein